MIKTRHIIPLILPAMLVSCGGSGSEEEEETKDYIETEYDKEIAVWLKDKDWKPERRESGLYVYIEEEGSQEKPTIESFLTLNYQGYLLDGNQFDGTDGTPVSFPFPVGGLITGWQEGIPLIGRGGKQKLIIPPDLGYGDQPVGIIPANAVLYFEIEIIDFTNEPPAPEGQAMYDSTMQAYISEKGIEGMVKTESGMYMKIEEAGSDEKPDLGSFLTLNYEGYLMDGSKFDGTGGEPRTFSFPVANLIKGWQEGIPQFGKGGEGKLIIPPYLGYGGSEREGIPANSILIFDMEIIDFTNDPPAQEGPM